MTVQSNRLFQIALITLACLTQQAAKAEEAPKQPGTAPGAPRYNSPLRITPQQQAGLKAINYGNGDKAREKGTFSMATVMYRPQIPVNFPIQLYPSNTSAPHFIASQKGVKPQTATAGFDTTDKVDQVQSFYKNFLRDKGWEYQAMKPELAAKIHKKGDFCLIEAKRTGQTASISAFTRKKDGKTMVTIVWCKA
jgi:hypothetical protein